MCAQKLVNIIYKTRGVNIMLEIVLQNKSLTTLNENELYIIDGGDRSDFEFGEFLAIVDATVKFFPIIKSALEYKIIKTIFSRR